MRLTALAPLLLSLSLALGASMTANAQTVPAVVASDATLLNISAQADAKRVPDVATLSAGVVTQAVDGNTAMRENAVQMDKVMAAIKAAGIAERDIQTSGINLSPQYRYADNEAPRITGYQANNTVSLKVRDITKLGKVLDSLAAQGANQINGPSFEIDQPEPVYDEARLAALKKAQARAETYAKSLGLRVRRIVSISEGNQGGFRPMPMMAMAAGRSAKAEMDTAVSPGESSVSVSLDVVFELGR
ncbi:SIMPL domain-containing protein [Stenotrophomonas sp.]|uniref:SIMPL domain-containing protein n=1 Tax=Stenotrophomonas sp. TaxID=69392 RepID=UPI0028A68768|nr:SIMPL domain-containing protein [Stenotrophomonas sp.]